MPDLNKTDLDLQVIEEAETCIWIEHGLQQVKRLVVDHGGDQALLDVIEFLLSENKDTWGNLEVDKLLNSGRLHIGDPFTPDH